MSNLNIELVVKTAGNIYRPIKIGDVVNENEHVENRVSANGNSKVFFLLSKDGPGIPAKESRRLAGLSTYYGRILAIQSDDSFIYVWAGKNPETDEALQRQEILNRHEFEHVVGEAAKEVPPQLIAEVEPTVTPLQISAPEVSPVVSNGPVQVALRYKKLLENRRIGAKLVRKEDLRKELGIGKFKVNNSRDVQRTLEDLGIAVFPDIYESGSNDHLLLALKTGYLSTHMSELLDRDDPCEIIEEALERALA